MSDKKLSRYWMKIALKTKEDNSSVVCRKIREDDLESLGYLMFDSYKDTIDYEGEDLPQTILEIKETVKGKYGSYLDFAPD